MFDDVWGHRPKRVLVNGVKKCKFVHRDSHRKPSTNKYLLWICNVLMTESPWISFRDFQKHETIEIIKNTVWYVLPQCIFLAVAIFVIFSSRTFYFLDLGDFFFVINV